MRTSAVVVPTGAPTARSAVGVVGKVCVLALVVAWVLVLRPQSLGGPAEYLIVSGTSMLPTYASGDVVVVRARSRYRPGDVVAYRIPGGDVGAGARVFHRIVEESGGRFVVRGDNRTADDPWRPAEADIVGRAWLHVPYAGHAVAFARSPLALACLAGALATAALLPRPARRSGARPTA